MRIVWVSSCRGFVKYAIENYFYSANGESFTQNCTISSDPVTLANLTPLVCGYSLVRKRAVFSISIPTAFVILDQSIMAAEEQLCLDGLTTCTCECACQGCRACSLRMEDGRPLGHGGWTLQNPIAHMHFQYFENNEYLTRGQFCCKLLSFLSGGRRRMRRKNNFTLR